MLFSSYVIQELSYVIQELSYVIHQLSYVIQVLSYVIQVLSYVVWYVVLKHVTLDLDLISTLYFQAIQFTS